MSMRIFSRQALKFVHPKDPYVVHKIQKLVFEEVPDWVKDSTMFKLAKDAGLIDMADTKTQQKEIEVTNGRGRKKESTE